MADIRSYMREKEKREKNGGGYQEKIVRHKLTTTYRFLLLFLAFAALAALIIVQYSKHIYTSYDIVDSVVKKTVVGTTELRLDDAILTYSKDGAHCTTVEGVETWNQTFEIQDIKIARCENTVAIGDYNGRSIYVANTEGLLGEITTNMPIRDLAVSQTGQVTAVLADSDVSWINTYSSSGELLYKGQVHMNNSGYPTAVSLSPGGELLGVTYLYVDAGVVKSNVAFYNLGEVGTNYSDHFVSVYNYTDMVIPYIQFMNDDTAFAVGDSRLMVYTGRHKPVLFAEHLYEDEILSIYYSEKYIGLIFAADNTENRYLLKVYDAEAAPVAEYNFDIEYTDILFGKDNFVIYNESECRIVTMEGVEKFSGRFTDAVKMIIPQGNTYKYVLVTDDSIDTIQMK